MSGVQFWRFPEEETAFLEYLKETGSVIALPRDKFRHKNEFLPMPLGDLLKNSDPDRLIFCLEADLNDVVIADYSDSKGEFFVVSLYDSPVIGYVRGKLVDSRQLSTSLLEAYWSYPQTSVDKPADFVKWGKKIFRWVQKSTPEFHQHKHCRITSRVAEAIRSNQVDLKSIGGGTF
jgi:hypothetical protein